MPFESLFSLAGIIAMVGWVILFFSPLTPQWSDRISGTLLPLLLSCGYFLLLILPTPARGGGFETLAQVMVLFSYEQAALAGWVHFLALDLFIGAWVCKKARSESMNFILVAPCLPAIFLFGPAGLLGFQAIRTVRNRLLRG